MNEKELHIIQIGMKLFATKGFTATSVQEITTESGISKGAFYLHFRSKDELLLAILHYHFDIINYSITEQLKKIHEPREILIHKYIVLFSHLMTHRDLIVMLSREQSIPRNETIKQLLLDKQLLFTRHTQSILKRMYGPKIEPFLWDITILFDGIEKAYVGTLLFMNDNFEVRRLAEFMINRLDSIVEGIYQDTPFFTKETASSIINNLFFSGQSEIATTMEKLEEEINELGLDALTITYQVLKEETEKEQPRIPVIHGMLSNFKGYPTLDSYCIMIEDYYKNE